jgi:hypothetical protein
VAFSIRYPSAVLERLFHLSASRTSIRTELVAGATTFLTMAYIQHYRRNRLWSYCLCDPQAGHGPGA